MTDTETTAVACPSCGKSDSIGYDNGLRLCLQCRHEWDPSTVTAVPPVAVDHHITTEAEHGDVLDILNAATADDVLGGPAPTAPPKAPSAGPSGTDTQPPANWEGQFALLPGGASILVDEDREDGTITGYGVDSTYHVAPKATAEWLGDDPVEARSAEGHTPTVDNEPVMPAILAVAGLALTVGVDAVSDDPEKGVGEARIGWLPPPANTVPEAEQGVAYAIALLIHIFGIDKAEVRKLAANLLVGAEGGTESENG